jgi:hypothetical protein
MQHTIENGIYGKGNIWKFYTVEDAEQHNKESESWKYVIEHLKKYLGKTWVDRKTVRFLIEGESVCKEYKIVGVEDNEPYYDYYWILEDDNHNVRYELVNSADFYKCIKDEESI